MNAWGKKKNKKRKRLSSGGRPLSCPHQRKEPSTAEGYTGLLRLVGLPTGRKAACSLAGKAYKSQATPPSPPPHPWCVWRSWSNCGYASVSLGEALGEEAWFLVSGKNWEKIAHGLEEE